MNDDDPVDRSHRAGETEDSADPRPLCDVFGGDGAVTLDAS